MSNEKAVKAERKLKALCDRLGITEGGRKWMDVALDPFKDVAGIIPEGYPDRITTPSVIQCVHESINVATPSGLAGANWDCNIFLDNMYTNPKVYSTAQQGPIYIAAGQGGTAYSRGGLIVRSAGSGVTLDVTKTTSNLIFENDIFANNTDFRVLAIGFEVHNTTSELNKQGAVTCYKISDTPLTGVTSVSATATSACGASNTTYILVEPPNTPANALDLPGSVQWKAEDGCYVVAPFIEEDNIPNEPINSAVLMDDQNTATAYYSQIVTNTSLVYVSEAHCKLPTALVGAFFSGLSSQTTLVVNVTYYVEQFPNWQSVLHRISKPGCAEDFAAIELYTKIVKFMPCGVPVNDNFIGALISGIANVARWVIPNIPRIISGVSAISGMIENGQQLMGAVTGNLNTNDENSTERRLVRMQNGETNDNRQIVRQTTVPVNSEGAIVPRNNLVDARTGSRVHLESAFVGGAKSRNKGFVVRNKRDPDFNRIVKYTKSVGQGNKWVDIPKNEKSNNNSGGKTRRQN